MQLNQVIAVVNGKKTRTQQELTQIHHVCQKPELFDGFTRTYQPDREDGEKLPSETKLVQYKVEDVLKQVGGLLGDLFDVVLTQDSANTRALADISVDGQTIAQNIPVTYLLFLEKQLQDVHTFVSKLPVLDPNEEWSWADTKDCYVSGHKKQNRTQKVPRNHVLAEATEHHPAQVQMYTEDVKIGEYTTQKFSGAIPARTKREMLERVRKLSDAVKMAREEANNVEVKNEKIGDSIFNYLFKK